jgi:hypothetical protein
MQVVGENQSAPSAFLDGEQWSRTGYKPTPTIIEAAQALYQGHRVEDITRSDAGAKNLSETAACLAEIIEDANSTPLLAGRFLVHSRVHLRK